MSRMHGGQPGEGVVKGEEVVGRWAVWSGHGGGHVQRYPAASASPFMCTLGPGGVYQDLSHRAGCGPKEMTAASPSGSTFGTDQSQIRLVDESRGLESLA